ncbi:MAG: hypothetical protein ABEJ30_02655 [Halorientalis sp.]
MADADGDAEAAITHIEARAEAIRDQQVQRALAELDRRGAVTPERRAAVAALADRLTDRLTAPAREGLRAAAEDDEEVVRVALALFG